MKWWAWAVMGGITYFGLRAMKKSGPALTDNEIDALMRKSYEDAEFQRMVKELAGKGSIDVSNPDAYIGLMQATLDLEASGLEKAFQSAEGLRPQVTKAARKIAEQLPDACPGAPRFSQLDPSVVRLSETKDGFRVVLVWPAVWASTEKGPVHEQVRACAERVVRASDKDINERLVRMTAVRL